MLKNTEATMRQYTSVIRKTTRKCGIEVPVSLNHAVETYSRSKRNFWQDDIAKEMKRAGVAFDTLETRQVSPIGHKTTSVHMVFHEKIDFTRKSRWFVYRHRNLFPKGSARTRVVS